MTSGLFHRAATLGALLFLAVSVLPLGAPAQAQGAAPTITFQNPKDGDTLGEKPFVLQMCFSEPINVKDLDKGGDFKFSLTTPEKLGLGLRIVFQPDGWGVSIYPGPESSLPGLPSPENNKWTWEWRVLATDDSAANEGSIKFSVEDGAEPIPQATPPVCLPGGGTGTPIPPFGETPTPGGSSTGTPTGNAAASPTGEPGGSPTPTEEPGVGGSGEDNGDGPDILPLALLTIGAAGGLGVLALIGYLVRRKVGFDPHAPTGDSDADHGEHH